MKITIPKSYYSGVDGASLSDTRCHQLVLLYDMLCEIGDKPITYKEMQQLAIGHDLYPGAKIDSLIRTFYPLVVKLCMVKDFNDYPNGIIKANAVFNDSGIRLVELTKAYEIATTLEDTSIVKELLDVKALMIQAGIISWYQTKNDNEHNIWLALDLFQRMQIIYWKEFLYAVYLWHRGNDIDTIIRSLIENRNDGVVYEFYKEDGKKLPDTCYTYIRSLLTEAHAITKVDQEMSKVTDEGIALINSLI